jgi:riboflavin synthase
MFTGIVEELGEVAAIVPADGKRRLDVRAGLVLEGSRIGSSLAVNGVCLTVVERGAGRLSFDLGPETLSVTNLGGLAQGDPVNLERPLRLGDPLGGHLVLGHVDSVGEMASVIRAGDCATVTISVRNPDLERYLIPKGSVAVDGVSLTVTRLIERGFEVMLIPHTLAETTLGRKSAGARVNLEMDLFGKYLYRFFSEKRSAFSDHPFAGR